MTFFIPQNKKRRNGGESIHSNYSEWGLKLFGFFNQKAAFKYHNSTKKTCFKVLSYGLYG